jgi:rhamnulose-1-phosphate aldolase
LGKHRSFGRDFDVLLEDVRLTSERLWAKGWAEKNAGNLSVNASHCVPFAPRTPKDASGRLVVPQPSLARERFLVTGTGVRFRDLAGDPASGAFLVQITEDGSGYHLLLGRSDTGWAPTSELPSHLMIHSILKRAGGKEKAVLHTHPTELIALTHLPDLPKGREFTSMLWGMLPEVKMYLPGGARLVPYAMPGSRALAEATCGVFREGAEAAVWEMHGVMTVGAGPSEAFDTADVVNKAAQVYLLARAAGRKPKGLDSARLAEIEKKFPPPGRRG